MKRLAGAVSVVAMALPGLVRAQFTTPSGTNLPEASLFGIIENIMNWILALVGILGVIGFAIAGVLYLTAAGDDGRIDQAKKAMTFSIIGVIVALVGLIALRAAKAMLGAGSKF